MPNLKRIISTRAMLLIAAMIAIMILSACGGQAEQPISDPTIAPIQTTVPDENTPAPVVGATATGAPIAADTAVTVSVSFSKDVLPILQSRCLECHGGRKTEKAFSITSYEHVMAGSEKGPVLIPGDPTNSKLIQLIQQGKMPKRGPKLLPDQLQILIDWIQAGALNN